MAHVLLALFVVLAGIAIGSALGNPAGGFLVGVVAAIALAKRRANAAAAREPRP